MVLPSLILRLEHLAQAEAPPAPAVDREPPARIAPRVPESTLPVFEPPTEPETAATLPPAVEVQRRFVDVAAPERLSTATPLSRWSAAVAAAHDACFVLDLNGVVISISLAAVELLGCGDAAIIGRHILEIINLVDLETGAPHPEYAPRITPLVVLDGPSLGRSLMRVRHDDGAVVTLDTSSAPIHDGNGHLLGSVTFTTPIQSR